MVTLNQEIGYDQAEEIAMEFDVLCEKERKGRRNCGTSKEDDEK